MRVLKWLALLIFVSVVAGAVYFTVQLRPVDRALTDHRTIVILPGQASQAVAAELKRNGLIRDEFSFLAYLKLTRSRIIPGTYLFSPYQSGVNIIEKISTGQYETERITLIEGWRARDIERYLVGEIGLSQMRGLASKAEQFEGRLFPDTYEVRSEISQEALIELLLANFNRRTEGLKIAPDVITLASIVEREAANDAERPMIAEVYLNRLEIGMRLEADPTIQYAKGDWRAVTVADYSSVVSPYNTYLVDGLPPGPIANPGLKSIKAVLNPADHDYLFFFHARGQIFFSRTFNEHLTKIRANF